MAPLGRVRGTRVIDLRETLARLREEASPARGGHRQVTLFHRTPVSHVLFAFEAGGSLPKHSADGLVTIQVLEGRLVVEADGVIHELRGATTLILHPNVVHTVHAVDASAMLLTIDMEDCA